MTDSARTDTETIRGGSTDTPSTERGSTERGPTERGPTGASASNARQAARDKVLGLILEASDEDLRLEELKPETSLRDELDLTSMQAITLVMDLEDAFGIEVEDQEIERLESVGDVLSLLDDKLAVQDGEAVETPGGKVRVVVDAV